jgi:hypothetical protein
MRWIIISTPCVGSLKGKRQSLPGEWCQKLQTHRNFSSARVEWNGLHVPRLEGLPAQRRERRPLALGRRALRDGGGWWWGRRRAGADRQAAHLGIADGVTFQQAALPVWRPQKREPRRGARRRMARSSGAKPTRKGGGGRRAPSGAGSTRAPALGIQTLNPGSGGPSKHREIP